MYICTPEIIEKWRKMSKYLGSITLLEKTGG